LDIMDKRSISVFGLGYVGAVIAGCLSQHDFTVIGIDVNKRKNKLLSQGVSLFKEQRLSALLSEGVKKKKIITTDSVEKAIEETNLSFICVGTPSRKDGSANVDFILETAKQSAPFISNKKEYHVFVITSTVPPGTTRKFVETIETLSHKTCGKDFGVCANPEFLREGTSVQDFYHPPYTIIGEFDKKSGEELKNIYNKVGISGNIYHFALEEAEIFKYLSNTFHAVKITFANEAGRVCSQFDVNSHEIMEVFCKDTLLNISPYYMKPGFAFGGSCLPKDVRGILSFSESLHLKLIQSLMPANEEHFRFALKKIQDLEPQSILMSGITFKEETDDLRESPYLNLLAKLSKVGAVVFYDPLFNYELLLGANKMHVDEMVPNIKDLQSKHGEVDNHDMIIIGPANYVEGLEKFNGVIFDLNGILSRERDKFKKYVSLV
jgi:GDP-mannose 6-dehydrogenase